MFSKAGLTQVFNLLMTAFAVAHFMSCGWAFAGNLADPDVDPEQAWFYGYTQVPSIYSLQHTMYTIPCTAGIMGKHSCT